MQLSTKTRYAVRALVELAMAYGQGPVKLKDIAASQDISLKYLEQVMYPLRVGGYVKTLKGSRGGYILGRPPERIKLHEIIQSIEGSLSFVPCVDDPEVCGRFERCATREVWARLKESVLNELKSITLAELAEKQALLYAAQSPEPKK